MYQVYTFSLIDSIRVTCERCTTILKADGKPIYRCFNPISLLIPTIRKSRLMMKLLTPFIWFFYLASAPWCSVWLLEWFVCKDRQSLKLQLTNYVIMISMMMNDIGLCCSSYAIKEKNQKAYKQITSLFAWIIFQNF